MKMPFPKVKKKKASKADISIDLSDGATLANEATWANEAT